MKTKCIAVFLLLFISAAFSLPASQNVKGFKGVFEIASPFTLKQGLAGFTLGVNNLDLKSGDIDVNRFFIGGNYGLSDRLEINLNLSYNRVKKGAEGINTEYPFAKSWQTGAGYASLGAKYNFVNTGKTGFGILGYVELPLSGKSRGVTTSKSVIGADLLFSHKIGKTTFSANAGYQINESPDEIDLPDAFKYAIGLSNEILTNFELITQFTGKAYVDSKIDQSNPINVILGVKYEKPECFGVSVAYKKNITFDNRDLEDTHGAVGSIWFYTGKKTPPPPPPVTKIISVAIKGDREVKTGEVRSYQSVIAPEDATKPVTYNWTVSENGAIQSGQGSPTISVKWTKKGEGMLKVKAVNKSSAVEAQFGVVVTDPVLPPKEEFFFALDSYDLSTATIADLKAAVEYFTVHPSEMIEIQGHTCSIATSEYNLALGAQRAEAIKKFLVDNDISPDRIKTISYGEEKPVYDNSAELTRKKNRRVLIPRNKK